MIKDKKKAEDIITVAGEQSSPTTFVEAYFRTPIEYLSINQLRQNNTKCIKGLIWVIRQ